MMPSSTRPAAFLSLILLSWFLTWTVGTDGMEQGRCVLEGVNGGAWLVGGAVYGGDGELMIADGELTEGLAEHFQFREVGLLQR